MIDQHVLFHSFAFLDPKSIAKMRLVWYEGLFVVLQR